MLQYIHMDKAEPVYRPRKWVTKFGKFCRVVHDITLHISRQRTHFLIWQRRGTPSPRRIHSGQSGTAREFSASTCLLFPVIILHPTLLTHFSLIYYWQYNFFSFQFRRRWIQTFLPLADTASPTYRRTSNIRLFLNKKACWNNHSVHLTPKIRTKCDLHSNMI